MSKYYFTVFRLPLSGRFRRETVNDLIPGALCLPRTRQNRRVIDLTQPVAHWEAVLRHISSRERHIDCLEHLFGLIDDAVYNRAAPEMILSRLMDDSVRSHSQRGPTNWGSVLLDFAFVNYILRGDILNGTPYLIDGLTEWLLRSCEKIAVEASLPMSLNFANLCDGTRFESVMAQLMGNLPDHALQALLRNRGNLALPLTRTPSRRIRKFIRKYWIAQDPQSYGHASHPYNPRSREMNNSGYASTAQQTGLMFNGWYNAHHSQPSYAAHNRHIRGGPSHGYVYPNPY